MSRSVRAISHNHNALGEPSLRLFVPPLVAIVHGRRSALGASLALIALRLPAAEEEKKTELYRETKTKEKGHAHLDPSVSA